LLPALSRELPAFGVGFPERRRLHGELPEQRAWIECEPCNVPDGSRNGEDVKLGGKRLKHLSVVVRFDALPQLPGQSRQASALTATAAGGVFY
jgi:hypothetical protein